MTAVRPTRRATCPKYSCDHHSGCPVRAPATVCGAGRVDLVGGDREHGVPRAGHAAYAVEEDEVAAVAGAGGLQVEAAAVEAPAEELPGGGGDGGAGAGPVQPHAVRGLGGEDVAEPGVDADAGQVPVDGAGQPPGPRVPGGRQGAVVLQRSGVDVQVADAGGRRPRAARSASSSRPSTQAGPSPRASRCRVRVPSAGSPAQFRPRAAWTARTGTRRAGAGAGAVRRRARGHRRRAGPGGGAVRGSGAVVPVGSAPGAAVPCRVPPRPAAAPAAGVPHGDDGGGAPVAGTLRNRPRPRGRGGRVRTG